MAGSLTRTTRVPHTDKRPEHCPYCGSTAVSRKGTRKKKIEIVRASCKRVFTPSPAALRNKTYPLHVVLDAITLYDLGYSLEQTAEKIRSRFGRRAGRSTIAAWLAEYRSLTTYARLRAEGRRLFPPTQAIKRSSSTTGRSTNTPTTDRSSPCCEREGNTLASRASRTFSSGCRSSVRTTFSATASAPSQKAASFLDASRLIVVEKENAATRMAALVIPTVGDNRLRHEALQRFMLANDGTTLAIEVPIWLGDIAALEREHGISLLPPGSSTGSITGHIDFLQVRNGAVHILDYKPHARADKPIAQLMIYALALTKLAGLRLFDIKCAWFDEEEYCEFFPRTLLARRRGQAAA
jgi:ATP-dependent exoDNAse (exonuclease V) beta subunit